MREVHAGDIEECAEDLMRQQLARVDLDLVLHPALMGMLLGSANARQHRSENDQLTSAYCAAKSAWTSSTSSGWTSWASCGSSSMRWRMTSGLAFRWTRMLSCGISFSYLRVEAPLSEQSAGAVRRSRGGRVVHGVEQGASTLDPAVQRGVVVLGAVDLLLDVEAAEQDVLVLVHEAYVVHELEALEALLDAGGDGEHLGLLGLVEPAAGPAAGDCEVVVCAAMGVSQAQARGP